MIEYINLGGCIMDEIQVCLPVDAYDGFNIIYEKYFGNCQINCILRLNGKINEEILKDAIRISLKVEPILGCCLLEVDNQLVWKHREDLDKIEACSIVETKEVEAELQAFVSEKYNYVKDCQVKIRIVRADSDTICVKIHHACSDAGGLKQYIKLLISIYDKLEKGEQYTVKSRECGNRSQDLVFRLPSIENIVNSEDDNSGPKDTVGFPCSIRGNKEQMFLLRKMDSKQVDAVRIYARQHEATVNDVLLTAYNKALSKYAKIQDNILSVCVTVDLRRYLPDADEIAICNFSGMNVIEISRNLDESFEETLSKVVNKTKKMKSNHLALKGALDFSKTFTSVGFKNMDTYFQHLGEEIIRTGVSNPWFSNVGVIGDQKNNFGLLEVEDCYIVGPAMFSPGSGIVPSTYNNTLTLSVNFFQSTLQKEIMEQFIDTMLTNLRSCVGMADKAMSPATVPLS